VNEVGAGPVGYVRVNRAVRWIQGGRGAFLPDLRCPAPGSGWEPVNDAVLAAPRPVLRRAWQCLDAAGIQDLDWEAVEQRLAEAAGLPRERVGDLLRAMGRLGLVSGGAVTGSTAAADDAAAGDAEAGRPRAGDAATAVLLDNGRLALDPATLRLYRATNRSGGPPPPPLPPPTTGVIRVPTGTSPSPTCLKLHLTDACNLRCRYCFSTAPRRRRHHMDLETGRRAVQWLCGAAPPGARVTLHLFGGEPLLRWDVIRPLVEWAEDECERRDRALSLVLTTNGTLLTPEAARWLASRDAGVALSLDGPPEVHDRGRPAPGDRPSYHAATAWLDHWPGDMARVTALPVVWEQNLEVDEVAEHLVALGLRRIEFQLDHRLGVTASLTTRRTGRLLRSISRLGRKAADWWSQGRPVRVNWFDPIVHLHARHLRQRRCRAGWEELAIDCDGSVYPCVNLAGTKYLRLGKVGDDLAVERGRGFNPPVDRIEACARCWARHLCGGGCSYHRLGLSDPAGSVVCDIYRHCAAETAILYTRLRRLGVERLDRLFERVDAQGLDGEGLRT